MKWWELMSRGKHEEPPELARAKDKLERKETEVISKLYTQGMLDGYKELSDDYARQYRKDN